MRRFIYLDTDTLNSYLAQIYDGLIQNENLEAQYKKSINKQNLVTTNLAGKIAFKLFGKGIDANTQATYEHLKSVADDEIVRDVQTKILHDNAFDQFMNYLHEHSLLNECNIGKFIEVQDEFYIFDIAFYKKMFEKDGFVDLLTQIQDMNTRKEAEKKFEDFPREQRRSKSTQTKINEIVQDDLDKNHENWDAIRKMVDMLAAIIPYPRILCISNYAVVLDEKYMRDNISTAAFKYGGIITVVGYVTNKVMAQADTPISTFSGIGSSMNTLMKIFFENVDEMYIVHPVAIYYDDQIL